MRDRKEQRQCNDCGESWTDNGEPARPFCGSDRTEPAKDDAGHEGSTEP